MRIMQTNGDLVCHPNAASNYFLLGKTCWPIDKTEEFESPVSKASECFWTTLNYPWLQPLWWLRVGWGDRDPGVDFLPHLSSPSQPPSNSVWPSIACTQMCSMLGKPWCFVFLLLPSSLFGLVWRTLTWRIPYVIWMLLHFTACRCNEVTVICGPGSWHWRGHFWELESIVPPPSSLTFPWLLPSILGSAWGVMVLSWISLLSSSDDATCFLALLPLSLCLGDLLKAAIFTCSGWLYAKHLQNGRGRGSSLGPWLPSKGSEQTCLNPKTLQLI